MRTSVRISLLSVILSVAAWSGTGSAADPASPLGVWKTFDDKTGQPKAIVRIYAQDGKLFGRIEQSFKPGA